MKKWREFFKPIEWRTKSDKMQNQLLFDTQMKTALSQLKSASYFENNNAGVNVTPILTHPGTGWGFVANLIANIIKFPLTPGELSAYQSPQMLPPCGA